MNERKFRDGSSTNPFRHGLDDIELIPTSSSTPVLNRGHRSTRKKIYEYDGPRPKSVFEGDFKIAVPDMATENHFSHTQAYDCFKNTDYVLTFSNSQPYSEKVLLGLLNSSIAEFIIKQESPFLIDRYYRYKTHYIESVPLPDPCSEIAEVVEQILH